MTDYRLIRSKRRTLAVQITPEGQVVVRAPRGLSIAQIEAFLQQKQDWIAGHSRAARERSAAVRAFSFTRQTMLPLRGREYPVRLENRRDGMFDGESFFLPAGEPEAQKEALIQCYRRLAQEYLPDRAARLSGLVGISPAKVTVGGARTRWGSCTGQGRIRFSWRLMTAPDGAVDYVIIHELCHLLEMNHSPRFWSLVEGVLPDYRQRQQLLRRAQEHPVFSL